MKLYEPPPLRPLERNLCILSPLPLKLRGDEAIPSDAALACSTCGTKYLPRAGAEPFPYMCRGCTGESAGRVAEAIE